MKIRPVGAELFYAARLTDGQTDMTELIVAFRNFANAHKNGSKINEVWEYGIDRSGSEDRALLSSCEYSTEHTESRSGKGFD